jgi:conjugal transfer pilus assembly protein TraL
MTKISRYIDAPPTVLFWEIDEVIVFASCVLFGLLVDHLFFALILGAVVVKLLMTLKKSRAEGFFMHFLYWHGIMKLKGYPPSYIREFSE